MPESHPLRGVALLLAALLCFSVLDATSKHLSQTFSVPLLVWARYGFHLLLMVVFLAPAMKAKLIITRRPAAQVVRALMLVAVTGFAMAAFRVMPLAETTALIFVTPLFVALLAGPCLGERVGAGRWLAVLAGFAGMLLVARPGSSLSAAGIGFALAAAACYSVYQIQTRMLAATESTVTMVFYTALVGTATMTLALPWIWQGPRPSPQEALMIASLGIYGGIGHFLLTRAFRLAPASTLSPFTYAQLIWAALLGWLVYEQVPDLLTIAGMVIIVGSGLAVAVAESRRAGRIGAERG